MHRKTWMEVDLDAIAYNAEYIKNHAGKKLIAVLKANAYGCGDSAVLSAVLKAGAEMAAVSSTDEALMLRNQGYAGELLILGPIEAGDTEALIRGGISAPVYSLAIAKALTERRCSGLKVHLALDTGMNRIGLKGLSEVKEAMNLLLAGGCVIEGIFTHFACADCDSCRTQAQYDLFESVVKGLDYSFRWIHCDNSAASLNFDAPLTNAVRLGIGMYGISEFSDRLKPALSFYTTVAMVKSISAGETVGYGAAYQARETEWIATVPVGYADGLIRSNSGHRVWLEGAEGMIVGRVCMDQCMIRLSSPVKTGTKVELFGPHIPLEQFASMLNTIPHEVITLISPRVTRLYRLDGRLCNEINERLLSSRP